MVTLPAFVGESRREPLTFSAWMRRAVSFPVLLGSLLVAGSYAIAKDGLLDPDMWWHVAVGQRILATHAMPLSDAYSSTVSGTPWIAYEWLGEVAMGAAAAAGGLRGAAILLIVLSAILVVLLYQYATLRCGSSKAAFVACATLIPIIGSFFTLRPQLFGALFLVATLIILERFRQGHERALWLLPPLFLCWVNTHGSFVFGFLVLGVTWLSGLVEFSSGGLFAERWTKRQSIHLLLAIFLCALMLPITPYGTRTAAYPLVMALSQPVNVKSIEEWRPLGADMFLGKFFLGIVMLFFLACLVERPKFRLSEVTLALFGVFAACVHTRFLLLFVIFFAPLWAQLFSRWVPRYRSEEDHPFLNACLIAAMIVGAVYLIPSHAALDQQVEKDYPQAAMQFLANHPFRGQMLNEYTWGGYLIWAHAPKNMIFIDGRADVYEYGGILSDYMSIMRLEPNALQLLKKHDIEALLIRQDSPVGTALGAMPGWQRVYQDRLAAVYVRKSADSAAEAHAPEQIAR